MRAVRFVVAWMAVWFWLAPAHAQTPFVLSAKPNGAALGEHLSVLEDSSQKLTLAEVQKQVGAFKKVLEPRPSFGLSDSAYWLRFEVRNEQAHPLPWLLEVAYSHLDHITLYIPTDTGSYERREAGDYLPFDARELSYRNPVFSIEEPARSSRTYFLRVQTSGSATVPLLVWSTLGFLEHQNRELSGFWLFYGVMMVMAIYNMFLYVFLREREYVYYVLYNVSLLLFEFTMNGHTFQYLVPNDIWLANHMLPVSIGMNYLWIALFSSQFLRLKETYSFGYRFARFCAWASAVLTLFALLAPYAAAIRVLVITTLVMTVLAPTMTVPLLRRGQREAKLYVTAWSALVVGVVIHLLSTLGLVGTNLLTDWGIQIGAGLEMVLLSLALADRINGMRSNLGQLNRQLSQNVSDLKLALSQAEAGTRAKLDFLATVSHELRTPLNAIINIPEGLLKDFPKCAVATCSACQTQFELEPGDHVDDQTQCQECTARGSLDEQRVRMYRGEPDKTVRHLKQIERSGKHLLQMVNGILDFNKVEAGKLALTLAELDVCELLQETHEELSELATRAGLALEVDASPALGSVVGDRLRIKQVLINLVGNAIKFSQPGGRVKVSGQISHGSLVLTVQDQGIGIAPEDCARIFESFEQVHRGDTRRYGGTGLGLSICKALVALHEGRIWVESTLGVGSAFHVSLPVLGPGASRAVAANDNAHASEPVSFVR